MKDSLRTHIEEIVSLTDDEFTFVASHFDRKDFKKNEFVIQQGEKVDFNYFVIKGLMKLISIDPAGKEHILSFAREDWWETDYLAFFNGNDATMSLQCLEPTELLCISNENLKIIGSELPKMEHFFLQKANAGHIASQQRILSLLKATAQERYTELLEKYPSLIQRVSKTQLAAYLGVSRETLSRFFNNKNT